MPTNLKPAHLTDLLVIIVIALAVTAIVFTVSLLLPARTSLSPLENIRGVPYPEVAQPYPQGLRPAEAGFRGGSAAAQQIQVTEELAHANLYSNKPALAQSAELTITFLPHNLATLAVGLRDNPFWLSYHQELLFDGSLELNQGEPITKTVVIPLTDKLQEADRSFDLMFFANDAPSSLTFDERSLADTTYWELLHIEVAIQPALPTKAALKDYLRSIFKRERAL